MRTFAQRSKAAQNKAAAKPAMPGPSILHLLSAIGNQAGQRLLRTQPDGGGTFGEIQSKPADVYEQEADRISDQIMRMPDPQPTRGAVQLDHQNPQTTSQTRTPHLVQEVVGGSGQPLDPETRSFMEPRFGFDFSNVRVHSGETAEHSAREVGAKAYTVGHHIVFAAGRSSPGTFDGRRLIAHELAHVMQQTRGRDGLSSSGGVLQRSPDEPKQDRQKWLEELGRNPQDAHNSWKKLSGPESAMVLSLMAQRFGWPFAQQFLLEVEKGGPPAGEAYYGRGTGPTSEQLTARGYRLGGYFNTGAADIDVQVWFHPSGNSVRKDVSGRKDIPTVPEIIQDCGPLTEVAMSILDDTITTETSAQEDLQGEKSRLENMNKTSSDYGQQFDDYVQSLKAMQDRLKTTEDDVNTMRGELVEMKCSVDKIDEKLQEMGELQIWVDIESDMGLQFLRPIHVHLMNTP